MAERTYTQVIFSVEGIQAYLFATGKLKEMIGGSEITASYPDKVTSICEEELSLTEADEPKDGQDWYCILQNAAGSVRLLVPNDGLAREILRRVSLLAIEKYPGLPLYGASVPCVWTTQEADSFAETFNIYDAPNPNAVDAANEQSFAQAFQSGQEKIAQKRAIQAMPPRSVWPFCRVAPLDGLPAVWKDKDQYVSAESRARSTQDLLNDAEKRFKEVEDYLRTGEDAVLPPKTEFVWFRDLDTMLEQSPLKKIALLHMDGNSLGALFRRRRAELKGKPVAEQNRAMRALSLLVDRANKHAFTCALRAIIAQEIKESGLCPAYYPVPARPLVLGGDDLTILIKANLAFDFADAYAAAFEAYTKEQNTPMSVGGGMVIIPKGYPFTRAFGMVEALTDNAKAMTETEDEGTFRPSSIDYLVLTNDIDRDILPCAKKARLPATEAF
ncbi:MAG: hypothetical protein IJU76_04120 [Desulfovibrionaceae bacterium]|nr:hypothetical protein [Desulfovibrionaceae bacterium]